MFIKKTDQGYSISGGISWIPLMPGKIQTRKELDEYYKERVSELIYATDDFKPARRYDVFWINKFPVARVDETPNKFLVLNLPAYSSDEAITDWLKTHARDQNKEALIYFSAQRPEPPAED